MYLDHCAFNKLIFKDSYPPSLLEDLLDVLNEKKFYSHLDLKDVSFHDIIVAEESRNYTSFVTPFEQFKYLCI